MRLPPLLDEHVPTQGHWVGRSLGWVTVVGLTHIVSEGDHRLHHVEPWAAQRLCTLRGSTGQRVHPLELRDDRLAAVLEAVSDDAHWQAFAGAWTQHVRRVYDLPPEGVRWDTTTASGSWRVTEEGLLQFGHSQDPRPDRPPVKGLRSGLDPLGVPVATDVVPGQRADAPRDRPASARVRERVGRRRRLEVGDGTMGALPTRACIRMGGEAYLGPLAEGQLPPRIVEDYLRPVSSGPPPLPRIRRLTATGTRQHLADGDERLERLTTAAAGEALTWTARRLVGRSPHLACAGERALRARLAKAQAAGAALNMRGRGKPRLTARPVRQEAVEAILMRYRVQGLRAMHDTARAPQRPRRRDGNRPATVLVARDLGVKAGVDRPAGAPAIGRVGWRVSATHAPSDQLSLAHAVLAYRSPSLVESDRGRLKGHPLSLTPMDLERDDHATGLIPLLSVGLRVLTLLECVIRQRLAAAGTVRAGLYAGNPQRATLRPTTERRLKRFQGLTRTILREGRRWRSHLTPLAHVPRRMLTLLNFPVDLYTRLCPNSHKPP